MIVMIKCKYCEKPCSKNGFQLNGTQKYRCKGCKKYCQTQYHYRAYEKHISDDIINLNNEGMGIRSMARFLKISHSTVIKRIRQLASKLKPSINEKYNQEYEMDELWTYCGKKENAIYLCYAINRSNGCVIDFIVGGRTKENLEKLVRKVLALNPNKIYTDGLKTYPTLIPGSIHKAGRHRTNRIERHNLTLRTHIKRLMRSTIAFSKKPDMLEACLRLYFWRKCP